MKRSPILFRYPGGKFYALNILEPFWLSIDHDEYREPFAGGGAIFFNKKKVKYNWLNDIDEELIITYEVISQKRLRNELVDLVSNEIASKSRWREIYDFKPKNKLEIGFRYFYLNRTSFSGKLSSPAWGYRPKRSLPPNRWKERIIPCGTKLENVKITHQDFQEVIEAPLRGKSVLMYIDPPYYCPPKKKHYRNGFSLNDHKRLCKVLKKTRFKFFLTYDDVPEIREMYNWANINSAEFYYRVDNSELNKGKRRRGLELIITNYIVGKNQQLNLLD